MSIDRLLTIIRERRSIREFGPGEVTDEEMRLIVEAARYAPSNSNRQAWKFLAVRNRDTRMRLRGAVEAKAGTIREKASDPEQLAILEQFGPYLRFFADAPLLFIVLYKRAPSFLEPLLDGLDALTTEASLPAEGFSAAMAIQNMLLAAHTLGLGACCTTAPLVAATEIRDILKIPPAYVIAALVPVGRPVKQAPAPFRKPIAQILEVLP
jgi:nitroreductase